MTALELQGKAAKEAARRLAAAGSRDKNAALLAIADACMGLEQGAIDLTLDRCLKNSLFSANDFKAAVESETKPAAKEEEQPEIKPVGDERTRAMASFQPAKSSLDAYEDVVKKAV